MELHNAIASAFHVPVPATLAFDYPTVAALAKFVLSHQDPPPASAQLDHAAAPSARHATMASTAEIVVQLQGVVAQVLGGCVSPEQPLMEVGCNFLPCVSSFACMAS